jgi:hypothetical protein
MPQFIAGNTRAFGANSRMLSASSAENFKVLKPKLLEDSNSTPPGQGPYSDDSVFEIEQLGARLLVDMKANLFRTKSNGILVYAGLGDTGLLFV